MQLLAEYNQLQAQAAQLLQTRIAQLQAEAAQLTAMYQAQMAQQAQVAQMLQPEAGQQQQPSASPRSPNSLQRVRRNRLPRVGRNEPEAAQQAPEMADGRHNVGIQQVVETQRPAALREGDPANPQHWVDAAAGRRPGKPSAGAAAGRRWGNGPTGNRPHRAARPRLRGAESVRDMQEVHAAFGGAAKAAGPNPSSRPASARGHRRPRPRRDCTNRSGHRQEGRLESTADTVGTRDLTHNRDWPDDVTLTAAYGCGRKA